MVVNSSHRPGPGVRPLRPHLPALAIGLLSNSLYPPLAGVCAWALWPQHEVAAITVGMGCLVSAGGYWTVFLLRRERRRRREAQEVASRRDALEHLEAEVIRRARHPLKGGLSLTDSEIYECLLRMRNCTTPRVSRVSLHLVDQVQQEVVRHAATPVADVHRPYLPDGIVCALDDATCRYAVMVGGTQTWRFRAALVAAIKDELDQRVRLWRDSEGRLCWDNDNYMASVPRFGADPEHWSLLVLVLRDQQGKVIGALCLDGADYGAFDGDEVEVLRHVANLFGEALG